MIVSAVGVGERGAIEGEGSDCCSPEPTGEQLNIANARRATIRLPHNSVRSTVWSGVCDKGVDIARRIKSVVSAN